MSYPQSFIADFMIDTVDQWYSCKYSSKINSEWGCVWRSFFEEFKITEMCELGQIKIFDYRTCGLCHEDE